MPKEEDIKYSKETLNLRLLDSHNNPLKYQEFRLFEVTHAKRYPINKIFTTDEKGECSLNTKEIFKDKTLSFELKLNHSSYYKDKPIFHFRRILRSYEYGHWCEFNFEEEERLLVTMVEAHSLDLNKEHEFKIKNVKLELRAYYNQEDDINHPLKMKNFTYESLTQEIQENNDTHNKQENTEDKFKEQKAQTKWGYIEFDKNVNTDEKLKELSHNFTTPIQELKEFIPLTDDEDKELLGENVHLRYKEHWENKQVRIFAYLERAKSDVSVEVEVRKLSYIVITPTKSAWYENETLWTWVEIGSSLLPGVGKVIGKGLRLVGYAAKGIDWVIYKLIKRASKIKRNKDFFHQFEYEIERVIIRFKNRVLRQEYPKSKLDSLPQNVKNRFEERKANNWKKMDRKEDKFKAGEKWHNDFLQLPTKDKQGNPIQYKEHDVNRKGKKNRGAERIVTGHDKDGKLLEDYVYYTRDHYASFIQVIMK